jgi:thiol-disulfide isomerase/thioredoxin
MFRVRPVLRGETGGSESNLDTSVCEGGNVVAFSGPSDVVGARREKSSSGGSSSNTEILKLFKKLPDNKLLAKGGMKKVSLSDAFANTDLVFLYASAHWCPPCRKYTPQLIQFYNDAKKLYASDPRRTKSVEIVFVSADHDMSGFKNYYASMPWLAVPYDADTRDRLLSWMKVSGVPRLMVLNGRTGKIVESNAVGRALDLSRFSKMVK